MVFFDKNGNATAYCDDGVHIFAFSGSPVAYFDGNAVFGFNGRHLGWFENGWMRDRDGECVFYTDNTHGGPVTPVRRVVPVKCAKRVVPIKNVREIKRVRPVNKLSLSRLSGEAFFKQ